MIVMTIIDGNYILITAGAMLEMLPPPHHLKKKHCKNQM